MGRTNGVEANERDDGDGEDDDGDDFDDRRQQWKVEGFNVAIPAMVFWEAGWWIW